MPSPRFLPWEHLRKFPRWALPLDITCKSGRGAAVKCRLRNISPIGALIATRRCPDYRVGAPVSLSAALPEALRESGGVSVGTGRWDNVPCHVVFVRDAPSSVEAQAVLPCASTSLTYDEVEVGLSFGAYHQWVDKVADRLDLRSMSPWLHPEHEARIVQLVATYGHEVRHLTRHRGDRWLAQFGTARSREDMLSVLDGVCKHYMFSERRCRELSRVLYLMILERVGNNMGPVRILTVGSESRGAGIVKYLVRVVNGLADRRFPGRTEQPAQLKEQLRSEGVRFVVFLDDFIGTGKTVERNWDGMMAQVPDEAAVLVCALVGYREALERISRLIRRERRLKTELLPAFAACELRGDMDRLFRLREAVPKRMPRHCQSAKVFSSEAEARRVYATCLEHATLYSHDGTPRPFGYGNLASPVVFYYNTPNNAPPVLWYQGKGWLPILPRFARRDYERWALLPRDLTEYARPQAQGICGHMGLLQNQEAGGSKEAGSPDPDGRGASRCRLYCIAGNPGTGKSFLAVEVCRCLQDRRPTFWCEFTEHSTAGSLRNELREYILENCADPRGEAVTKWHAAVTQEARDDWIFEYLQQMSPVLLLHHLDAPFGRKPALKASRESRGELKGFLRRLVARCGTGTWLLLTADSRSWADGLVGRQVRALSTADVRNMLLEQRLESVLPRSAQPRQGDQDAHARATLVGSRLSSFCAVLAAKLYKKHEEDIDQLVRLREGSLVERFLRSLRPETQRVVLCAAAIRFHRTDGILAAIYERAYGKRLNMGRIRRIRNDLVEQWKPLFYRDCGTGDLLMADRLRQVLFNKLEGSPRLVSRFHSAVGMVYEAVEARDWTERIEHLAACVDHFLRSGKADDIERAADVTDRWRAFFAEHAQMDQLGRLNGLVLEAMVKRGLDSRPRHVPSYLRLNHDLIEVLRLQGRYDEVERRSRSILGRKDLVRGNELRFADVALRYASIRACRGEIRSAIVVLQQARGYSQRHERHLTQRAKGRRQKRAAGAAAWSRKVRCCIYRTHLEMCLGNHAAAWQRLRDGVESIKALKGCDDYRGGEERHTLADIARHVSTLYYLDGDAVGALRWANVSRALNHEIADTEGEAVSLLKASCAWSLLGDETRAAQAAAVARRLLHHYVPQQVWWHLAAEKALCLSRLMCMDQRYAARTEEENLRRYSQEALNHVEEAQSILGKVPKGARKWLGHWHTEVAILKARVLVWRIGSQNGAHEKGVRQVWLKAWRASRKWQQKSRHPTHPGAAPQLCDLYVALGQLARRTRKPHLWVREDTSELRRALQEANLGGKAKIKWFHQAIYCFAKAVDYLARDLLGRAQEAPLRLLTATADEVGQEADGYVEFSRLWAATRLVQLAELRRRGGDARGADRMAELGERLSARAHSRLSMALESILDRHGRLIGAIPFDASSDLWEKREQLCTELEGLVRPVCLRPAPWPPEPMDDEAGRVRALPCPPGHGQAWQ